MRKSLSDQAAHLVELMKAFVVEGQGAQPVRTAGTERPSLSPAASW